MTGVQTCALPICFPVTIRPTTDEILYESQGVFVNRIDMYEEGFIDGAEWVVNKIKGGDNDSE